MSVIVNDVVLICVEDRPAGFAKIENILPDAKKNWYHVKLLMLKIPLHSVTWILHEDYINGVEFSMNSTKMQIKKVECPEKESSFNIVAKKENKKDKKITPKKNENIILFSDFKNKKT